MKRKLQGEKNKQEQPKTAIEASIVQTSTNSEFVMPPPEALLEEAEEEHDQWELASYVSVISKLRSKHFTYRQIAEWLTERGVPVDHNSVYRVYTNSLSDYEAAMEEEAEREELLQEAMKER